MKTLPNRRPRKAPNVWCQTKQKGKKRRGTGKLSTYARLNKRRTADRYTRPYLTGEYRKWMGDDLS